MPVMGEICQHGQLRRVCHTCELLSDLTASRAENARLREAIERAPHDSLCDSHIVENILDGMVGLDTIDESKCDCWKRDAPGGDK